MLSKIWLMFHHEGTKSTKDTKASAVYEVALCKELWLRGLCVERQVSVPVSYKGESLNCEVKLDLLVEKSVVLPSCSSSLRGKGTRSRLTTPQCSR